MKKNKFLLFAAIAMAVLTSCGGGQKGLPTSNEYPVVTIGPANAQSGECQWPRPPHG